MKFSLPTIVQFACPHRENNGLKSTIKKLGSFLMSSRRTLNKGFSMDYTVCPNANPKE